MTEHQWHRSTEKGSQLMLCTNEGCTVVWPPYLYKPKSQCTTVGNINADHQN